MRRRDLFKALGVVAAAPFLLPFGKLFERFWGERPLYPSLRLSQRGAFQVTPRVAAHTQAYNQDLMRARVVEKMLHDSLGQGHFEELAKQMIIYGCPEWTVKWN